jgi:hypothetical protein
MQVSDTNGERRSSIGTGASTPAYQGVSVMAEEHCGSQLWGLINTLQLHHTTSSVANIITSVQPDKADKMVHPKLACRLELIVHKQPQLLRVLEGRS